MWGLVASFVAGCVAGAVGLVVFVAWYVDRHPPVNL